MDALLIVPLLVSGYLVLTKNPYHFYRLYRYDGQLLYLKAAGCGFMSFIVFMFISFLVKFFFPAFHPVSLIGKYAAFSKDSYTNRCDAWIVIMSIGTIIVGLIWAYISRTYYVIRFVNGLIKGKYRCDMASVFSYYRLSMLEPVFSDRPMSRMFYESLLSKKPMLLTLKCGKVYVGIVSKVSEPTENEGPGQEIVIVPGMSGYRDKNTQRVMFINDYRDLKNKDVDSSITIPCEEIHHASWFTKSTHDDVDNNLLVHL